MANNLGVIASMDKANCSSDSAFFWFYIDSSIEIVYVVSAGSLVSTVYFNYSNFESVKIKWVSAQPEYAVGNFALWKLKLSSGTYKGKFHAKEGSCRGRILGKTHLNEFLMFTSDETVDYQSILPVAGAVFNRFFVLKISMHSLLC